MALIFQILLYTLFRFSFQRERNGVKILVFVIKIKKDQEVLFVNDGYYL